MEVAYLSPRVRVGLTSSPAHGGGRPKKKGRRMSLVSDILNVSFLRSIGFKFKLGRELSTEILNHWTPFISVQVPVAYLELSSESLTKGTRQWRGQTSSESSMVYESGMFWAYLRRLRHKCASRTFLGKRKFTVSKYSFQLSLTGFSNKASTRNLLLGRVPVINIWVIQFIIGWSEKVQTAPFIARRRKLSSRKVFFYPSSNFGQFTC